MKDIILERNKLRKKSSQMRPLRFDPNIKDAEIVKIEQEQTRIYNKFKFYDNFLKARDNVKDENKSNFMGKEK